MIKNVLFALLLFWMAVPQLSAQQLRSDSAMVHWLRSQNVRITDGNRAQLMKNGVDKFNALFEDIRHANHSVHMDYFAMRNDSISNRLFTLLAAKKKQGVENRLMLDAVANKKSARPLKEQHFNALNELGINIYLWDRLKFPWINHVFSRDHRKIAVIDGRISYIGGMNVADYYILGLPIVGPWRDMQVRFEGPVSEDLQRIFAQNWKKETKEEITDPSYFLSTQLTDMAPVRGVRITEQDSLLLHLKGTDADWERGTQQAVKELCALEQEAEEYHAGPMYKPFDDAGNTLHPQPFEPSQEYIAQVAVLERIPHKTASIMRDFYIQALDGAKERVLVVNPYLTLTSSVRKAFKRAIDRGVDVQLMISAKCDVKVTPDITMRTVNKLRKRGAKVHLFDGGFHHSKLMMVDGLYCTVGSTNLDARSLRYDCEAIAVIMNQGVTAELERMFANDCQVSHPLDEAFWTNYPRGKKTRGNFLSAFAWLF